MTNDLGILERALQRVLNDVRPYLDEIIVIGGWVPYLYQRYGDFPEWQARLALTSEVDLLVRRDMEPRDRPELSELMTTAGMKPVGASATVAIWANDPERGEKVEFLTPHEGTIQTLNAVVPLRRQPGVGAIALDQLEVMALHTQRLEVMTRSADNIAGTATITVPTLGAYALNKAATFTKRQARAGEVENPKRAKDLLYLRDLAAAGDAVMSRIGSDSRAIGKSRRPRFIIRTAVNNLDGVLADAGSDRLRLAGAMLAERDGVAIDAATADVRGHLEDLREVLLERGGR